ncbi:hypothetical protein BJ912DRAFT_881960 [Pholiota molesta]|nr:hypothetical protein BJ912DRAFT_881960 [Pholiota molesta]
MDLPQLVPQNLGLETGAQPDSSFTRTFSTPSESEQGFQGARISNRPVVDVPRFDHDHSEQASAFNPTFTAASELHSSNEDDHVKEAQKDFSRRFYDQQLQPPDFQPWFTGDPCRFPLPNEDDPWDQCFKSVMKFDEEMCRGWREEVDTLLVFAGLFSAAVTAFTIESYRWLQEDPQDVQVQLLRRISDQLMNGSDSTLMPMPSLQSSFVPSPTSVRVNAFWFTSLTLSLSAVLTGILCKQWLREYQRYEGLSAKDAFPVRQLRYEGLLAWHVPGILSSLPLLLQASLVLFFGGLLDLLWTINSHVAVIASSVVGISLIYLVATTVSPSFQSLCAALTLFSSDSRERRAQCAFKSPQSWAFRLLIIWIISLCSNLKQHLFYGAAVNHWDANWVKFDQRWQKHGKYIQRGISWFEKTFVHGNHNLGAIYNVYNCLESLEPDVSAACVSQIIENHWNPLLPLFGLVQPTLKSFEDQMFSYDIPESFARDMVLASYLVVHHKAHSDLSLQCVERCTRMLNDLPALQGLTPVILEILNMVIPAPVAPDELGTQITTALSKAFLSDSISTSDQLTFWSILHQIVRKHQNHDIPLDKLFYQIELWLTRTMLSPILPHSEKQITLKHSAIGISSVYRLLRIQASFSETVPSAGPSVSGEGQSVPEYLRSFIRLLDDLMESTGGSDMILSLWEARDWNMFKQEAWEEL